MTKIIPRQGGHLPIATMGKQDSTWENEFSLVYCPLNVELYGEKQRQRLKLLSPTTLFSG